MKPVTNSKKITFPPLLVLLLLWLSNNAWGKVYIDIDAPTFQQFAIAIPDFRPVGNSSAAPGNAAVLIPENLSNQLRNTGFFNFINKKAFLEDDKSLPESSWGTVRFSDWIVIGAEYLVKGVFQYQGNDLVLNCRLYDVVKGEPILEKRYAGKSTDINLMIQKFAGEILYALTGEGGIFFTRIAFIVKQQQRSDIVSVNFDGSDPIKEKEGKDVIMSPRWSPDGRYLSFTSFDEGNPDFYVKDRVNGSTTKIVSFRGINLSGGWSPDGKKVLLTLSKDGNEEIYALTMETRLLQRLTNNFSIDVSPSWSPDGTKIVFVSDRSGSPQVYIMDADGNNARRLTFEGNYNSSPSWSPKGDMIAYEGRTAGGKFQIFTIGANGDNIKQLTFDTGESNSPSWSSDGRYIVLSKDFGGRRKICIMNKNGSNLRVLHEENRDSVLPTWSYPFSK